MTKNSAPKEPDNEVNFWLPDGSDPVTIRNAGRNLAFYWSHVVRSRGRWRHDSRARAELVQDARTRFESHGLSADVLHRITRAGIVEIEIPYSVEGWAPRILPWEFLLNEMTKEYRKADQQLLVIRRLTLPRPLVAKPARHNKVLFVENNPSPFDEEYSYETELSLVQTQLDTIPCVHLSSPMLPELETAVKGEKPSIVHLAGVDVHQARELLTAWGQPDPDPEELNQERMDGLVMNAPDKRWEPVDEERLAVALTNKSTHAPLLVSFNIYNSGARLAPMAVARGAQTAVGFYDTVNDALAERFFSIFYQKLRLSEWSVGYAFHEAMKELNRSSSGGAYMVLWSSESLLSQLTPRSRQAAEAPAASEIADRLFVSVTPLERANYARLQANEPLFEVFNIYRRDTHPLEDIAVEVTLFVGRDSFPFRRTVKLPPSETVKDLSSEIQLPLLSTVQRSLREGVRTLLQYRVTCGGTVITDESTPVLLSAVNEWWWDPKDDSRYLASFVLPDDPAVLQIIDAAQKYLHALRDDFGAGFDGYQSFDPESDEPSEAIDQQVRAIWSVLSFESSLHYINPPPVFANESQRLRSPSDVLKGRRGTCIDLALLLGSCLEFIDLYPVIFVLKDHAFPGYWRSEADWEDYTSLRDGAMDSGKVRTEFDDVKRYIAEGKLVPLETVLLTSHSSFQEAIEECENNLAEESRWGRLLDIHIARQLGVTPLPLLDGQL